MQRPIAISLFSGAGGLDIGLEDAGFDVRCAVENNAYACATLRANKQLPQYTNILFDNWFQTVALETYGHWEPERVRRVKERVQRGIGHHSYLRQCSIIEGDIKKVSSDTILESARAKRGEVDLVVGGPPCQSFSRAGKRESVHDERGQLFMEFVRVVRDVRPRWLLFENVKGLILSKPTIWKVACNSCGHEALPPFDSERATPLATDAAPICDICGSLKTRWLVERNKQRGALELIVAEFERVGYKCQPYVLNVADYGAAQHRERLFIIGSRDGETFYPPVPTHVSADTKIQRKYYSDLSEHKTVWETLFSHPNLDHPWPLDPKKAVLWVKNVVRPHDEPVTWTLLRPSPTIGAHQSAKLAIAPCGVPDEQLARQQWHVLGRRQGDTEPVPVEHTYLSDADLLRLQTFPDFWFVAGTRMERAFQIGNAVPPLLAQEVGLGILGAKSNAHASKLRPSMIRLDKDVQGYPQQLTLFEGKTSSEGVIMLSKPA